MRNIFKRWKNLASAEILIILSIQNQKACLFVLY